MTAPQVAHAELSYVPSKTSGRDAIEPQQDNAARIIAQTPDHVAAQIFDQMRADSERAAQIIAAPASSDADDKLPLGISKQSLDALHALKTLELFNSVQPLRPQSDGFNEFSPQKHAGPDHHYDRFQRPEQQPGPDHDLAPRPSPRPGMPQDQAPRPSQDAPQTTSRPSDSSDAADRRRAQREDYPILQGENFSLVAKVVLAKLDANHTGTVTKDQLARALRDPSFTGFEAQALAALYQNFDRLAYFSRGYPEAVPDKPNISNADLDAFQKVQQVEAKRDSDAVAVSRWARAQDGIARFGKDGKLTHDDLQTALKRDDLSDSDRRMLEFTRDHFSEIGNGSALTSKDFSEFPTKVRTGTPDAQLALDVWYSMFRVNESQSSKTSRDLYGTDDPLKSITADAVKQGDTGDCYFQADLAAVAAAHPEMIRNAITDNHDGTYTVRFAGAKDEPITVKAPTEAELGTYSKATDKGIWAAVMEKAFGQYLENHFWERVPFNIIKGYTPQETAGGGGSNGWVMDMLTGGSHHTRTTLFSSEREIAADLEKAFKTSPPKAVSASASGFAGYIEGMWTGKTEDGFDTAHAYTILNFVPDGRGGGMVTVRNPHAGENGTPQGTMTIPLSKFMKNFSNIAVED